MYNLNGRFIDNNYGFCDMVFDLQLVFRKCDKEDFDSQSFSI